MWYLAIRNPDSPQAVVVMSVGHVVTPSPHVVLGETPGLGMRQ